MSPPRIEFPGPSRRVARWWWPAALLALTPKCLLCVMAYVGLGAALGLGGPELCSAQAGVPVTWIDSLALLGTVGLFGRCCFLPGRRTIQTLAQGDASKAH